MTGRRSSLRAITLSFSLGALMIIALPIASANAAPGALLRTVVAPTTNAGGCSINVGIALRGTNLLVSCYYNNVIDVVTPTPGVGTLAGSITVAGQTGLGALAYDAVRDKLWACHRSNGSMLLIDPGGGATTTPVAPTGGGCFDGIAYDSTDDTLYHSDDASCTVGHTQITVGGPLAAPPTFDVCTPARLGGTYGNSGIAVGGNTLYMANNGGMQIYQVDKSSLTSTLFTTLAQRIEDMECDSVTFAPKSALWVIDAYDRMLRAFEIAAGSCNSGGLSADTAPKGLDHFKCYTVVGRPIQRRDVTLRDQFGVKKSRVERERELCNPVRKTLGPVTKSGDPLGPAKKGQVTPIANKQAHLVCRRTVDSKPTAARTVRLRNQFGIVIATTTGAQTLCIPSLKRIVDKKAIAPAGSNPEAVLDHFRCYGLKPQKVQRTVGLRDQFGKTSTKVVALIRLCNPVRKTYHHKVSKIKNGTAHLACYSIVDAQSFEPRRVVVRNQFGVRRMRVSKVAMLCLPTYKQVLKVAGEPGPKPAPFPAPPPPALKLVASSCANATGIVHTLSGKTDPPLGGSIATAVLSGPGIATPSPQTAKVAANGTFTAQTTTPAMLGRYPVVGVFRWNVSVDTPDEQEGPSGSVDDPVTSDPPRC